MNFQSILLLSSNIDSTNEYINKLVTSLKVEKYNLISIEPDQSIGIDKIRSLVKILNIKPINGKIRLFIINSFEKSTSEAQNALLKILEEPTIGNYFLLTANNKDNILPTIVSRCFIKNLKISSIKTEKNFSKTEKILIDILSSKEGKRLSTIQKYSQSKDDALLFLNEILQFSQVLLTNKTSSYIFSRNIICQVLKKTSNAVSLIDKNINYKAVLDLLILSFPSNIP